MLPESGEWRDFLASAGRKLGFELRAVKAVTRYDEEADELLEEDWRHGTLRHIRNKDQLQVHTKMPDSDESEEDPSSDEERESLPGNKPPVKHWPYLDIWLRPAKCSKRFTKRDRQDARERMAEAEPFTRDGPYARFPDSSSAMHACALPDGDANEVVISSLTGRTTAVVLCQGGRFAGAIFEGERCIAHKCYSRYVVRAKQGRRQGRYEKTKRGGGAGSAGGWIRRQNETKLAAEIRATLEKWKDHLDRCDRIYVFAPSPLNKVLLISKGKETWGLPEDRVRNIPFQPRRPAFAEAKRVHAVLHRMYVDPDRV